mgnify:CR=1 FL=1
MTAEDWLFDGELVVASEGHPEDKCKKREKGS